MYRQSKKFYKTIHVDDRLNERNYIEIKRDHSRNLKIKHNIRKFHKTLTNRIFKPRTFIEQPKLGQADAQLGQGSFIIYLLRGKGRFTRSNT